MLLFGLFGLTVASPLLSRDGDSKCMESLSLAPQTDLDIANVHLLQKQTVRHRAKVAKVAAGGAFGAGGSNGQEDGQVAGAIGNLTLPCIPYCREALELYVAYGAGLAYVHVAKCAGTTIEAAFGFDDLLKHNLCTASMLEACRTPALTIPLVASFRNPFDRAVSAYSQSQTGDIEDQSQNDCCFGYSFKEWLQATEDVLKSTNLMHEYCQSASRQVDCVFSASGEDLSQYHVHTETLDDDWEKLRDTFPKLPSLGQQARNEGDHDPWCSLYGREEAEMVARMYAADFKFLNLSSNITDYCSG